MSDFWSAASRVLVTGGAGFIGSHLCDALLQRGMKVVALDNLSTGVEQNLLHLQGTRGFEFVHADVEKRLDVGGVDAVFHLASRPSPIDYQKAPLECLNTGVLGTINALDLARREGARFLLASTSEVYGDPLVHPQAEAYWGNVNPVGPRSVYDEAKRVGETYTVTFARRYLMETRIARIFNTYGPRMRRDDGRAVPAFLTQALSGEAITVFGEGTQTRSLCYVSDLVDGLLRLMASDEDAPVNLGNPHEVTILELAATVRRLTGVDSPIEHRPLPVDDPRRRRPDISRAKQLLGWSPRIGLEEGLKQTLTWWRETMAHPVPV